MHRCMEKRVVLACVVATWLVCNIVTANGAEKAFAKALEDVKPYPVAAGQGVSINLGAYRASIDPTGVIRQIILSDGTRVFWEGRLYGQLSKPDKGDFPSGRLLQNSQDEQKQTPVKAFTAKDAFIIERESTMGLPKKGAPKVMAYKERIVFRAKGLISVHYEITYLEERAQWAMPFLYLAELPTDIFAGKPYRILGAGEKVLKQGTYPTTEKEINKLPGSMSGQEIIFDFPGANYAFTGGPNCEIAFRHRGQAPKPGTRLRIDVQPTAAIARDLRGTIPKGTTMTLDFEVRLPATGKGKSALPKVSKPDERAQPGAKFVYKLEHNKYLPEFTLAPKDYDLWYGQADRVYLNGWWRLRKLPDTNGTPKYVTTTDSSKAMRWKGRGHWVRDGKENPPDDLGTREKFYLPQHDDSTWPRQPVPWDWNRVVGKPWGHYHFGGVGWYRKRFQAPAAYKGRRVVLHFNQVEAEARVWLNGQFVGRHQNVVHLPVGRRNGDTHEPFSFDVTEHVRFGQENVLAVRCYDDGLYDGNAGWKNDRGGIWGTVHMDFVPHVYLRRAFIKSDLAASSIAIDARMINPTGKAQTVDLVAECVPFRSPRYRPPVEAPSSRQALGTHKLAPGANRLALRMKLNGPVTWNIERPMLYHLRIMAKGAILGEKLVRLGQERFGYHEFVARDGHFYLNGIRTRLFGANIGEPHNYRRDCDYLRAHNYDNWLLRWYQVWKGSNVTYHRYHSGRYPQVYYDIADEVGIFICEDRTIASRNEIGMKNFSHNRLPYFDFKTGKFHPAFADVVRKYVEGAYNNPSVILTSFGNEICSTRYGTHEDTATYLNAKYRLDKATDPAPTKPITSSSGRSSREEYYCLADWNDIHDYVGYCKYTGDRRRLVQSSQEHRAEFRRRSGGVDKPYVNGECFGYFCPSPTGRGAPEVLRKLAAAYPKIDRELYAKYMSDPDRYAGTRTRDVQWWNYFIRDSGVQLFLTKEGRDYGRARYHKGVTELFRRNGDLIDGFNLHALGRPDSLFASGDRGFKSVPLWQVCRNGLNPIFAGLNLCDRNMFAGTTLKARLYTLNDSFHDEQGVSVGLRLVSLDGKMTFAESKETIGRLAAGERNIQNITFSVPAAMETRRCRLLLHTRNGKGETLHENEYERFVLARAVPQAQVVRRIGLYTGGAGAGVAQAKRACRDVGIRPVEVSNLRDVSKIDVLLIPPGKFDPALTDAGEALRAWVVKGGRIVCLEAVATARVPWVRELKVANTGPYYRIDQVMPEHPAFESLRWDQFNLWNGPDQAVYRHTIVPVVEGVIASGVATAGRVPNPWSFGMILCEVKLGRGLSLCSSILGFSRYGEDAAGTHYAQNLLRYVAGKDWDGRYAAELPKDLREPSLLPKRDRCFSIDLRKYCNRGFRDKVKGDGKDGWDDQGGDFDMRQVPVGKYVWLDVPVEIIDPAANNGKSCIVLKGKRNPHSPMAVNGIAVGAEVKRLFFLMASTCTGDTKMGEPVANIRVVYQLGGAGATQLVQAPIVRGVHVTDWTMPNAHLSKGQVAWTTKHHNRKWNTTISLYLVEWHSPYPGERIETIDFVSTGGAIPALLAVTGERSSARKP